MIVCESILFGLGIGYDQSSMFCLFHSFNVHFDKCSKKKCLFINGLNKKESITMIFFK